MMRLLSIIKLLKLSLPNSCLLCHQSVSACESGICQQCLAYNLYKQPTCLGCGAILITQTRYCGCCQGKLPLPIIAPASYHSMLGPLIGKIKYQRDLSPLPPLITALTQRINLLSSLGVIRLPQALLPVPLHSERQRQRGFNQAWLIAKMLSNNLSIPLVDNIVMRTVNTAPQAELSGKVRANNLKNAFVLANPVNIHNIAIIDDVVTTGTTVNEMVKALKPLGVDIQVWCLARAEAPSIRYVNKK